MRLYHFLPAKWALDNLRNTRLKISEINKLNDPFELWCVEASDKKRRMILRKTKNDMAKNRGLICFSASWQNPLLWSHYAERHDGVCLGFDVPVENAGRVRYVSERMKFPDEPNLQTATALLFTKYKDWYWEDEVRVWLTLGERDPDGNRYAKFAEQMRLRQVIVGPLCRVSKVTIDKALGELGSEVSIIKARLAFKTFRVVKDQRGLH